MKMLYFDWIVSVYYLRNNSRMPGSMLILTWVGIIFVIILDAGLYAYFNMGRHYICHYFTPSDLFLGAVPITSRYYLQEYITLQKPITSRYYLQEYPTVTSARSCNKVGHLFWFTILAQHETNDVILYIHSVHKHRGNSFQRQNYKMRLKQRSLNWINSMQVKQIIFTNVFFSWSLCLLNMFPSMVFLKHLYFSGLLTKSSSQFMTVSGM